MGFTEALTIVFVVCKLLGIITWSWWLVLLPEIIAGVFYLLFLIGFVGLSIWAIFRD
ncbi:transmembrane fragile-X-F protein [Lactobacillus phage Lpa804]|uniref:Transmembrane fragile-X-F protein n=1 Tax=Lactobacillus phage Lpa804 TaxID=2059850 RepID=A0A3Q8C6J5_9CAUD|nr:transmembrane fragile-X-F protein [Lactobacillus phage Lpa804]AUG84681.1 transmembrane fragile-X-F protein [Lactobacillus phage Lpa804]